MLGWGFDKSCELIAIQLHGSAAKYDGHRQLAHVAESFDLSGNLINV